MPRRNAGASQVVVSVGGEDDKVRSVADFFIFYSRKTS